MNHNIDTQDLKSISSLFHSEVYADKVRNLTILIDTHIEIHIQSIYHLQWSEYTTYIICYINLTTTDFSPHSLFNHVSTIVTNISTHTYIS